MREHRPHQVRRGLQPRRGRRQQHAAAQLVERQAPAVRDPFRVYDVLVPAEVRDVEGVGVVITAAAAAGTLT